jgi:hypothetical protein
MVVQDVLDVVDDGDEDVGQQTLSPQSPSSFHQNATRVGRSAGAEREARGRVRTEEDRREKGLIGGREWRPGNQTIDDLQATYNNYKTTPVVFRYCLT